jgi:nitrate/nitrite transporter NarK
MNNIKDTLTTIAGVIGAIGAIGGTILVTLAQSGIQIPSYYTVIVGICVALSSGILGYFNGKNADGSSKTFDQLKDQEISK